jgi:N-acetylglucosamine-6-phosphate deacetylase
MDEQEAGAGGVTPRCHIAGVHLEGPWLAPDRKGAHAPSHLRTPALGLAATYGDAAVTSLLDRGRLRVITLAPELPGALAAIEELGARGRGVVMAIGHTTADYALASRAVRAGARLVTHMFNAMPPFGHREPGVAGLLGVVADDDTATGASDGGGSGSGVARPWFSLITDGAHVHPAAVAVAAQAHPDGLVLVTDAMRAMGVGTGAHHYGDLAVHVHAGKEAGDGAFPGLHVVLAGTATLAGAVAPLHVCVGNLAAFAHLSVETALAAASMRPAQVLGLWPRVGSLSPGSRADVIVLDPVSLAVRRAWVGGREAAV